VFVAIIARQLGLASSFLESIHHHHKAISTHATPKRHANTIAMRTIIKPTLHAVTSSSIARSVLDQARQIRVVAVSEVETAAIGVLAVGAHDVKPYAAKGDYLQIDV
jgi:hypothetical protein